MVKMAKSQRLTKQKATILEILRSVESHPTAEWIYQEARKRIPGLSLGTVYRNLNQLKENKEILELNYGSTQSRFDGKHDNHYHFCCSCCGRVFDVHMPVIRSIETKAKAASDFLITGHRLEFYGLCSECRVLEQAM
jgi:Fur family ferric uptake transcriptional regulator/Fur family peroxide stress response transcriptional regulator